MIDKDSLTDHPNDIPLFKEDGSLAEKTEEIVKMLVSFERDRQITLQACNFLYEKDLLEPWTIRIQTPEGTINVQGLLKVNEEKFYHLSPEDLTAMKNNMALSIYFAQLYSISNLRILAKLYAQRLTELEEPTKPTEPPSTKNDFNDLENLIKNLKFPKN